MNSAREDISVALFNLLANNAQLKSLCKTITRKVKIWSQTNEGERPFLTLFKGGPGTEEITQNALGLNIYRIRFNLWLYVTADPSGASSGETVLNAILDAVDAAIQSVPPGQAQTLGGLVTKCYLEAGTEWAREFEDENIVAFSRIAVETGV